MLVETLIKDSCSWLTPAPEFFLASLDWFNDYADSQEQWPVCLMENVTPCRHTVERAGLTFQEYDVLLFFLHNYPVNDSEDLNHNPQLGSDRHTAVDTMRKLADDLLHVMYKDTRVMKPGANLTGAITKSIYNFMDLNLDGVQLNFTIRLLHQTNVCVERHDGPQPDLEM